MTPFAKYLIDRKETISEFSRRAQIHRATVYRLYHGRPVNKETAKKVESITKGDLAASSIPIRLVDISK